MICPKDRSPLHDETFAGLPVNACERCKGVWFPFVTLAQVQSLLDDTSIEKFFDRVSQLPSAEGTLLRCPVDDTALKVIEHRSVQLDICLTCRGIWFDKGELLEVTTEPVEFENFLFALFNRGIPPYPGIRRFRN